MNSNPTLHHLRGRADKPCSSLDVPKYAPYRDGKGQLDFGMKPIEIAHDDDSSEAIFDIDKFWPFYMNKKHWLLDNCRDVVYQDINKKRMLNTHLVLSGMLWMDITSIETGFGYGVKNPNWEDWGVGGYRGTSSIFEYVDIDDPKDHRSRNFFGGPFVHTLGGIAKKYGLEALARVVQEDLCILRRRDDGWNLRAAAVCFPSYWSLKEKMGKPLCEVHGPVPHLTPSINALVTKKLDELPLKKPVERFNWTLTPTSELHQPSPVREPVNISSPGLQIFVRVERQTMTKLSSGDVLFTIRTYLNPLRAIVEDHNLALGLYNSIKNTDPEVLAYRGIDKFGDEALKYIETNSTQFRT